MGVTVKILKVNGDTVTAEVDSSDFYCPLTVDAWTTKGEPMTGDYPGCDAECEIHEASAQWADHKTAKVELEDLEGLGIEAAILAALGEHISNDVDDYDDDRGDYLLNCRREER